MDPYVLQNFEYFGYNSYHNFHAIVKHLDYFCYHSHNNFHETEKNGVHNHHIATCSHTKFHQTNLNSFCLSQDQISMDRPGEPVVTSRELKTR